MKLLVVIPGFGPNYVDLKKKILKKNIDIIRKTYQGEIIIKVFNYGSESCDIECEEIFEKGVIGQFIYKYIKPEIVSEYDNIILLLDDIELSDNFDTDRIIKNLEFYKLDLISPILDRTSKYSHIIMVQNNECQVDKLRKTGFVEFFCYLMTIEGYKKWYNLLDNRACWLWGIDFSMYYKGITSALLEGITMHHHIISNSYNKSLPNPMIELAYNRSKFKFLDKKNIINKKESIKILDYI
jgi:hypothetical protein